MSSVRGDDAKLRALVEKLARAARGDVMRALRQELAAQTREEIDRSFRERRSPEGSPWKPVQNVTAAPLVASGSLRAGFDAEAVSGGVRVTNRTPYANVHQRGARIRRRRKATKRRILGRGGGVVPARPMVPSSRWGPQPKARLHAVASRVVHRFFLAR